MANKRKRKEHDFAITALITAYKAIGQDSIDYVELGLKMAG